jgi:hypothetical protein
MQVPRARGPLSQWVSEVLVGADPGEPPQVPAEALTGNEDAQLALWMSYELHYRGFDDAPPDAEWDLRILAQRRQIERRFEHELRAATADADVPFDADVGEVLLELADSADGPSIALRLQRDATADQMRDYLSQRSIVQLKESDPHSFVLGRLDGRAKVALAELQYDEYGGGRPGRLHAALYAQALRAAGLDARYGAYIEQASAVTLASVNVMSMFAFNRRLRGASMGHLAIFEATSSLPCRRISRGLERLGFPEDVRAYFDEHVEADAVHEHVVAHDICGAMVDAEPALRDDVIFGALVCVHMDDLVADDFMKRWDCDLQVAS